ncbi:MAG: TauD/TfdA dioxygenase family protein [Novosphingobium sp.]
MKLSPATGALGADVRGIDLGKPLDPRQVVAIRRALNRYQVLFFREQPLLSKSVHLALARHFGEPEPTPFRMTGAEELVLDLDQTDPRGSQAANFHSDNTFRAQPPIGALLQAHRLPERGGDTCFASTIAAFEGLSKGMQRYLEGLEAWHSLDQMASRLSREGGPKLALDMSQFPARKHPVIARHPFTGRKLLNVNYNWTTHIDGIPASESTAILGFLFEHIRSPEYHVRLKWNAGDIAFWDNRATQHYAVPDYNDRRVMQRVSILMPP